MLTACRVFMAMTLAGQVVGQASSFLPDYSKGKLAAAYIFRMMNVEPNIDNFSTTGLHKVGVSFGSCVIGWGMPLGGDVIGWGCNLVGDATGWILLGWRCHWVGGSGWGMPLGEGVFGWECHWMRMSLGGGVFWVGNAAGWGCHWLGDVIGWVMLLGGDFIG